MKSSKSIVSTLYPVIEKTGAELGYSIWDVEYVKEGAEWYLRITLDSDNGIDIDDCEKVSRAINPIIDEADPIEDFYYLEVSSPGLERVLRKQEHFDASIGCEVDVRLFAPDDNKKKAYTGILVSADEAGIVINVANEALSIPKDKISKVQTIFDFSTINMKED